MIKFSDYIEIVNVSLQPKNKTSRANFFLSIALLENTIPSCGTELIVPINTPGLFELQNTIEEEKVKTEPINAIKSMIPLFQEKKNLS